MRAGVKDVGSARAEGRDILNGWVRARLWKAGRAGEGGVGCGMAAEEEPRVDDESAPVATPGGIEATTQDAEPGDVTNETESKKRGKTRDDTRPWYRGRRGMLSSTRTTSETMRRSRSPVSGRQRVSDVVTTVTVVCGPPRYESSESGESEDGAGDEDD